MSSRKRVMNYPYGYSKRPRYVPPLADVASRAALAARMKMAIRRFHEKKVYAENPLVAASPAHTTSIVSINTIVGSPAANFQRLGADVQYEKLVLKATIDFHASSVRDFFRISVVYDTENTGTAPTEAEILGAAGDHWLNKPFFATDQSAKRFRLLCDRIYHLKPTGSNAQAVSINVLKRPLTVSFTGTGSGNTGKNSMWLITSSFDDTNQAVINAYTRGVFIDV